MDESRRRFLGSADAGGGAATLGAPTPAAALPRNLRRLSSMDVRTLLN